MDPSEDQDGKERGIVTDLILETSEDCLEVPMGGEHSMIFTVRSRPHDNTVMWSLDGES